MSSVMARFSKTAERMEYEKGAGVHLSVHTVVYTFLGAEMCNTQHHSAREGIATK